MKKLSKILFMTVLFVLLSAVPAFAAENRIKEGVFAGSIDLSGLSEEEARQKIAEYVSGLESTNITMTAVGGNKVTVTAGDLGLSWANTEIVDEAVGLGTEGNVIKRFKELSDLKRENKVYDIQMTVDDSAVRTVLTDKCSVFDTKADNATLEKSDGSFSVQGGADGESVNIDDSAIEIEEFFTQSFNGEDAEFTLKTDVVKPKGDPNTLSQIQDRLGTFTTKYTSSGSDRCANVQNGCKLINGTVLYPGEQLSVLDTITPFSEDNGYKLAGSYLNGKVVESFGGGICQVSTTLYQAVLRSELQVDERSNHSMVVNYVDLSGDAAIAESSGKDFKFTNNLEYPIYIEGVTPGDKTITFTIYGKETRDPNRSVEFESVEISKTEPATDQVVGDSSMAAGKVHVQSAHTGYKAELWKIVKENGEEKERTKVNSSYYQAVPRIVTVGLGTDNPVTLSALQAAVATQNGDYAKAVAASVGIDGGAGALAAQQAVGVAAAANATTGADAAAQQQAAAAAAQQQAADQQAAQQQPAATEQQAQ
ncbi:MAG: VanW family protein [Lachnospiraceae bacterium]|nr:VanW family protein [Lachnospiraceae bacterium]